MPNVFGPGFGHMGASLILGGGFAPPLLTGGQAPTLFADFVAGNYWYNGSAYPTFAAWNTALAGTFSRSSTATYIQGGVVNTAASGTPRLTSNGIRLTGPGTNLHLHSAISDSIAGYTTGAGTLTANAGADPTGGSTAASFVPTTASTQHYFFLSAGVALTSGNVYTYHIFVKPNGYTSFQIDGDNLGTHFAQFTASGSGTVNSTTGCTATIVALAGGIYLASITFTASSTGTLNPIIYTTGNGTARSYTGDGVSGYYFWGEQFTLSAFDLDHIPTTTTTVAQAADSFSFPFTQRTFSALVGTNGTPFDGTGIQRPLDCAGSGPIYIASATVFDAYNGAATLSGPTITNVSNPHKVMVAGNATNTWITADALTPTTAAQAINTAAPTSVYLGSQTGSSAFASGNYSKLAIWNALVASTSDLQRLTT